MTASIYIFLLTLILTFTIMKIVRIRMTKRIGLGDGDDPELIRAIRVHGNFVEMVPFGIIILLVLELQDAPVIALHLYGAAWVIARIAHAQGIYSSPGTSMGRTVGAVGSLLLLLGGALAAAVMAVL